jgi:hypothetical protein
MASRLPAVLLAGADLKHTDKAGNTAIWLAISRKDEAAVEVLLQAIIAADEDDDWAYNLKAEEVSDLEVDEVREALEERGLDVEGDDALVRARLVQAIEREEI